MVLENIFPGRNSMVDFLFFWRIHIFADPAILLDFTSIFGSIVPLFDLTKKRNVNSLGIIFKKNRGVRSLLFPVAKKKKIRNANSLGIILDFHVFISHRQERYRWASGRRRRTG